MTAKREKGEARSEKRTPLLADPFSLTAACIAKATQLGFAACGIATLEPSRYGEALDRWLAAGYAGTMRYLHRQARRRKDPASIVPGARVAVVVLENYLPRSALGARPSALGLAPAESRVPSVEHRVRIAKYALGTDYHRSLQIRLEQLAGWLREHGATVARVFTDAGPVPERELAERAGLGWIGKNTMLIRPGAGSYFLIGSVFTDLALPGTRRSALGPRRCESTEDSDTETRRRRDAEPPSLDLCGSCTRCLDACPTGALLEPRVLDATRCISYHTIESRAPIPREIAERMDGWAFGCDICNDVCPWNVRFARPGTREEYQDRGALPADDPGFFDRMEPAEFEARFGDTPLERPGLFGMRRNWKVAFRGLRPGVPR